MNVGEFGNVLRYNVKEDVSTSINTMIFVGPEGTEKTVTPVVGTATIDTPQGRFLANEYLEYTFLEGDIDKPGTWRTRVCSEFSPDKTLKSDLTRFRVKP